MPVESRAPRDGRESPFLVSTSSADSDDSDFESAYLPTVRADTEVTTEELPISPVHTLLPTVRADTEATTEEPTISPVHTLVPEMPTDVPTVDGGDADNEQAPAHADTQILKGLLVRACAEVQEVTGALIRSSTARVEDLANRISQLEKRLAEELKALERANRDVQSHHQPPPSENDILINS